MPSERTVIGTIVVTLLTVVFARAVPPPNDHYSNRIAITTSPMVLTASLAEATFETFCQPLAGSERTITYTAYPASFSTGSVWWSVSPTNSSSLTVEILNPDPRDVSLERVTIWSSHFLPEADCHYPRLISFINSFTGKVPHVTASAYCPTNFAVQLSGVSTSVVLRFTLHTEPLLIVPPQSRTVSVGESVFFGVVATGSGQLRYQWLHNDQFIEGETYPIFYLDDVNATNAGIYRVIVTDDFGATSAEVTLTVSKTDIAPYWREIGSVSTNEWSGRLATEAGRSYRIEVSTNLVDWSPVARIAQESSIKFGTGSVIRWEPSAILRRLVSTSGVVFLRNSNAEVRFTSDEPQAFFRVVRYDPSSPVCINNLKKVRFAKELWAYSARLRDSRYDDLWYLGDRSAHANDWVGQSTLNLFMRTGYNYRCPENGHHTVGEYGFQPDCDFHPLLEPDW